MQLLIKGGGGGVVISRDTIVFEIIGGIEPVPITPGLVYLLLMKKLTSV